MDNNPGVVYSERKEYKEAAAEYGQAPDPDPRLPAALYNWGNDLLRQGAYRKAVRRFSKRRDFEEALRIEPGFEQAKRNLERIQSPQ